MKRRRSDMAEASPADKPGLSRFPARNWPSIVSLDTVGAPGGGRVVDENLVRVTLDAVERMNKMFRAERFIYLGSATAAIFLLGYAAFLMIRSGNFTLEQGGLLFGSGGLFAVSGARLLFLLNRTYDLIDALIRKIGGLS